MPSKSKWQMLHKRMVTLVTRILVEQIPCLEDYHEDTTWHIPHLHAKESSQISEFVSTDPFLFNHVKVALLAEAKL